MNKEMTRQEYLDVEMYKEKMKEYKKNLGVHQIMSTIGMAVGGIGGAHVVEQLGIDGLIFAIIAITIGAIVGFVLMMFVFPVPKEPMHPQEIWDRRQEMVERHNELAEKQALRSCINTAIS